MINRLYLPPGHLTRQHGPDSAVRVADRGFNPHWLAPFQGRAGLLDELVIQRPGQTVVLRLTVVDGPARMNGRGERE